MSKTNASRRLLKELKQLTTEQSETRPELLDVNLTLISEDDLFRWRATIRGPEDTPYQGGLFDLDLVVPSNYPLASPMVTFSTKVFHPNVHFTTGEICLDLLKSAWSAVYTLQSVCRSIISLLAHPEGDSPLNCDCGNLIRGGDLRGYRSMARMYTRLYASFEEKENDQTL
eukprot:TRINITY_DN9581_c0_g1_i1.p1 TRINITY_DN9581_c0_g1~~TRINITY_DN9581_c0_g1_i1.p1  ORF type:complete len:171 (-),score=17.42 TRINITY_DN9581_c0_g1_i1:135-647(-)